MTRSTTTSKRKRAECLAAGVEVPEKIAANLRKKRPGTKSERRAHRKIVTSYVSTYIYFAGDDEVALHNALLYEGLLTYNTWFDTLLPYLDELAGFGCYYRRERLLTSASKLARGGGEEGKEKEINLDKIKLREYDRFLAEIQRKYKKLERAFMLADLKKLARRNKKEFSASVSMNKDAARFQRVVFVTNEGTIAGVDCKGKVAWDDHDPNISAEEHVNRIGKSPVINQELTEDNGVIIRNAYFPRVPINDMKRKFAEYISRHPHIQENLKRSEQDKKNAKFSAKKEDFFSPPSELAIDSEEYVRLKNEFEVEKKFKLDYKVLQLGYIDLVCSVEEVIKNKETNPKLYQLYMNNDRNNSDFLDEPLDIDKLTENELISYRIDLIGDTRWIGVRDKMKIQILLSLAEKIDWERYGDKANGGRGCGGGERADFNGNSGEYANHKKKAITQLQLYKEIQAEITACKTSIRRFLNLKPSKENEEELIKQRKLVKVAEDQQKALKESYDEIVARSKWTLHLSESKTADELAAVTKGIFPSRYEREVANSIETGSLLFGSAGRSAWMGFCKGYDSPLHREKLNTEETYSTAFAVGSEDPNSIELASSFIFCHLAGGGLIMEGGEGCISGWRAESDTHGTGRVWERNHVTVQGNLRLRGGVGELGVCQTRKLRAQVFASRRRILRDGVNAEDDGNGEEGDEGRLGWLPGYEPERDSDEE